MQATTTTGAATLVYRHDLARLIAQRRDSNVERVKAAFLDDPEFARDHPERDDVALMLARRAVDCLMQV